LFAAVDENHVENAVLGITAFGTGLAAVLHPTGHLPDFRVYILAIEVITQRSTAAIEISAYVLGMDRLVR
jgi:hypothetical protein